MFEPKCGHDIAMFEAASTETESFGIPAQFPRTRDKPARENRSLYSYRLQSRRRYWRSFHPCKSVPLFLLFVSFRVFRGLQVQKLRFSGAENGEVDDGNDPQTKQEDVTLKIADLNKSQESAD